MSLIKRYLESLAEHGLLCGVCWENHLKEFGEEECEARRKRAEEMLHEMFLARHSFMQQAKLPVEPIPTPEGVVFELGTRLEDPIPFNAANVLRRLVDMRELGLDPKRLMVNDIGLALSVGAYNEFKINDEHHRITVFDGELELVYTPGMKEIWKVI